MAQLVVLYKTPKNADAFDKYYFATHVPLAKKLPGTAGDLANFADGGADLYFFDTKEV
jgi:hypothetical protein